MSRAEQISFYRKQVKTAKELKLISEQNVIIATQLESEATRALELLGNSPKRTRKGVLSDKVKLELQAQLMK